MGKPPSAQNFSQSFPEVCPKLLSHPCGSLRTQIRRSGGRLALETQGDNTCVQGTNSSAGTHWLVISIDKLNSNSLCTDSCFGDNSVRDALFDLFGWMITKVARFDHIISIHLLLSGWSAIQQPPKLLVRFLKLLTTEINCSVFLLENLLHKASLLYWKYN